MSVQQCMGCGDLARVNKRAYCIHCEEIRIFNTVEQRMHDIDNHSQLPDSCFPRIFWEWVEARTGELGGKTKGADDSPPLPRFETTTGEGEDQVGRSEAGLAGGTVADSAGESVSAPPVGRPVQSETEE